MLGKPPTCSLSPVIPNNARHLRITAAAGTKLAVASSGIGQRTALLARIASVALTVVYIPKDFIPRGVAPSGFRPLRKIRYCSPPWGSGQCLSPNVPGQPLSPGTRRSLGRPLPYQQADGTWAAPRPVGLPKQIPTL